ncbi:MAG: efflux RND transporter periplasmic adaptor subunit [Gemmatimonadetes bacterium]|nr:efflux RND transporter periplasmic adaptor subunit [Gemmatimonadota bacterium]
MTTRLGTPLKTLGKRITRLPPVQKAASAQTWRNGKVYLERHPGVKKVAVTLVILFVIWKASTAIAAFLTRPRIDMTMSPIAGAVAVSVEAAQRGPIARTVTYTGSVRPITEAPINPRIQGWVRQFLVNAGARVRAGQPLVVLDREEIGGEYAQARAHYDFMARELERAEKLFKGGAISQSEYDRTRMLYDEAAGRKQALEARLEYTTLRAPIDGLVTHRVETINLGELVGPGNHLLTVADVSRVRVQVKVAESDLPFVRTGTEARVRFPTLTLPTRSEPLQARVSTVFPGLEPVTRTSTVEVVIANPEGRIKPDMYAVVDFVLEKRDRVVVLPHRAILDVEGTPTVFVTDGVTATARPVTLGVAGADRVEIVDGVGEGEMVVVKGNRGLVDGQPVKPVQF